MVFCKKCGYDGIYTGTVCPGCGAKIEISEAEKSELWLKSVSAKEAGDYETVVECYRILSDFGHTEAEREYARLLERGGVVPRNIDAAMDYFYRAAKKSDAYSAYKYSRLVSRLSDVSGKFWLAFSAVLGCAAAYFQTAEDYAAEGKHEWANYYYYLAALGDDVDAIVKLAMRYYNGDGIEKSEEYAKWYMDKLTFPPVYAIKLAYKLRTVKSKEAPKILCKNFDDMVNDLIAKANKYSFDAPVIRLFGILADRGNSEALSSLGDLYLSGKGTEKNPAEAVRIYTRAAASGNVGAYIKLGNLYYDGTIIKRNFKISLSCFDKAAKLGSYEAYETIGDIYHDSEYEGRDIALACKFYERAAEGGRATAEAKAEKIKSARKSYYYHASAVEDMSPEEAFKGYAISTALGYSPATVKVAECYALGIGVERDRAEAVLWYQKAADEGCDIAYFPLGVCFSRGIGTNFDYKKAVKYLRMAKETGEERAIPELERLYKNKKKRLADKLYSTAMRLIYQKKFAIAAQYLDLAVKLEHAKSTYTLGCLYEFGRGVKCDKALAYRLYDQATSFAFADPRSKYKLSVLKMLKTS